MAYWYLYWVESNGIEDCFVIARNSRSARRVECDMNGFSTEEVKTIKIMRIPAAVEKSYLRRVKKDRNEHPPWPWYAHQDLFKDLGAEFRLIGGVEEMLLQDVVYSWNSGSPARLRSIGKKALSELKNIPESSLNRYDEEDLWETSQVHLLTMLGMCVARCQQIEFYIAHSFLLGASKNQKSRYKTIKDLVDGWKKKTLGNLLHCIDEAYEIEPIVRESFDLFLEMRNKLIHGITTSEQYDINTPWGQSELVAFLAFFDIVSRTIRNAFRSCYYASIVFGMKYLDKDGKLPKDLLTPSQIEETSLFAAFFSPKEHSI